jgi:site-specific recombinase XerD
MKSRSGVGSLYKVKGSNQWHGKFYHRGNAVRFSCKTESEVEAGRVLKNKIKEAGKGTLPTHESRHTKLKDLRALVLADYANNEYDTPARQTDAFNRLDDFFGADCLADDITTTKIEEYKAWRRQQPDWRARKRKLAAERYKQPPRIGCAAATINRELAALRHAFALARRADPPLVTRAPYIPMLKERNRRKGFFEWDQFAALRENLPDYLKPVMTVSYYTGWRVASDLLTRERRHIVKDWLELDPNEGKNEEPRRFPLDVIPELKETIQAQLEATRKLEVETGRVINLLFHHDGRPIVDYMPAWDKACAAAGLSGRRIPHDFRRTAARNLVNAGVDPLLACQLVGWEDLAMLKRYNIINDDTLRAGVTKLAAHIVEQKKRPAKIVALR